MGDQTADEYFSKIEAILILLTDLGSDTCDDDVVTYAINGLSNKYGSLAQIIAHKDPFPDLATVRSMVATEESSVTPPKSVGNGILTLGCDFKAQGTMDKGRMDDECQQIVYEEEDVFGEENGIAQIMEENVVKGMDKGVLEGC
ncbi:hypothetical protein Tco_0247310 [Tanacetum coccineum]